MTLWAGNNQDRFPLPSELDVNNSTVAATGETKNTTGNILSILIFHGGIKPEHLMATVESNTANVRVCKEYQFATPKAAINPASALWDPAFRGTPLDLAVPGSTDTHAHQSYATLVPLGNRLAKWKSTTATNEPVLANRGPQYIADDSGPMPETGRWRLPDHPQGTGSFTLLIHGGRTTWEGLVAFNDEHVAFETKPIPDGVTYTRVASNNATARDNLFVNESDEIDGDTAPGSFEKGRNAFLRPIASYDALGLPVLWRD